MFVVRTGKFEWLTSDMKQAIKWADILSVHGDSDVEIYLRGFRNARDKESVCRG